MLVDQSDSTEDQPALCSVGLQSAPLLFAEKLITDHS